jgi:hypothetical protein
VAISGKTIDFRFRVAKNPAGGFREADWALRVAEGASGWSWPDRGC